jgi:polyphosphate glucokinase
MAEAGTASAKSAAVRTLAIDIGGTGIKAIVLDPKGAPLTERARIETPQPATPDAVIKVIVDIVGKLGDYDRISVGYPGVVRNGKTETAANLDKKWIGFDLEKALFKKLGKPVRVCNDADVQGFGAVEGHGVELVITLGTGLGCALFVNGQLVPNLELAHHPYRRGKTYEQMLGKKALEKVGKKKWNKRLQRAIKQLETLFNYDHLFIGGGNAKKIKFKLPANARTVENMAGLLGGIALWRDADKS